jgi:pilus assembly protein Flp/PilA
MNKFLTSAKNSIRSFAKDEEGAQVVEYALIIAVVSLGLILALYGPTPSLKAGFGTFVSRVSTCLTATCV